MKETLQFSHKIPSKFPSLLHKKIKISTQRKNLIKSKLRYWFIKGKKKYVSSCIDPPLSANMC